MKPKRIFKWVKILSGIGMLLASYLLWAYLTKPAFQPCHINDVVNCDAVTKGPVAVFLGIPVALIGLVGYIIIFWSAYFHNKKLVFGMSAFGLLFCLRITIIELFIIKTICPVCLACQIIMILIFLLSGYLIYPRKPADSVKN